MFGHLEKVPEMGQDDIMHPYTEEDCKFQQVHNLCLYYTDETRLD